MPEISEGQLDLIAARAEAATPGPWEAFVFPNPNDEDFIRTGGWTTTNQTYISSMNHLGAQGLRFQKRTWTSSPQSAELTSRWPGEAPVTPSV
jgi:hypothetical protein